MAFLDKLDNLQTHLRRSSFAALRAVRLSEHVGGVRIFLKRRDLNHTGSHKINNVLGQALLARQMGKTRVIARPAPASMAWRQPRRARYWVWNA